MSSWPVEILLAFLENGSCRDNPGAARLDEAPGYACAIAYDIEAIDM